MKEMRTALLRASIAAVLCLGLTSRTYAADNPKNGNGLNSAAKATTEFVTGKMDALTGLLQQKYSQMLGVLPDAVSNVSLYSFIDKWYGVKYKWGGSSKKGIDCSALMQKLYETVFGTSIVRTSIMQYAMIQPVKDKDKLEEGDLVFFKTRGNFISHVGMYLKNNYFVHSCSSAGVTISSLDNNYWSKVYAGAGKIPKALAAKML